MGLPKEPIHIEEPAKNVIFKNITLKTVHGRRIWSTWEDCEALIADGKVGIREGPSGVRIDNPHSPGILLCGEPKVVSTVSMRLL